MTLVLLEEGAKIRSSLWWLYPIEFTGVFDVGLSVRTLQSFKVVG